MSFSPQIRYLLVTVAILCASMIQLARGYRPIIVIVGSLGFLFFGNLMIFLSGSKERAARRQQKRDYFEGRS